jgi:hypothetical protein
LALAIKPGMWGYGNNLALKSSRLAPDAGLSEIETAALAGLYRHAVSECDFDPVADVRKAIRAHAKSRAEQRS